MTFLTIQTSYFSRQKYKLVTSAGVENHSINPVVSTTTRLVDTIFKNHLTEQYIFSIFTCGGVLCSSCAEFSFMWYLLVHSCACGQQITCIIQLLHRVYLICQPHFSSNCLINTMWLPNSSLTTLVSKITMDRLRQFPEVSNIICLVFVSLDSVHTKVTKHIFW